MDAKPAVIMLHTDKVIFECPFCGRTLLTTTYDKVGRLMVDQGRVRGKVCAKCGKTVAFKFDAKSREKIASRIPDLGEMGRK